ncbi:FAD:protein FMN transferase [Blautia faecis]|uniref:FAD:protein FMN transferase n=1 Tax=Blautia faecis TaxID=871665 RepID=UPI001956EED2|nr:FAD:protein FMN transferase [Blautia faecis]
MKRKVLTAAGICIGILILTEGSRYFVQNQKCQKQLFAMDTYMEFTAYGKNSEKAVDAAIEEVQKLDAMLSAENSKSEVYALNEQGNLQATDDLAELILRGKEIYQETDGLFDDTIYPVMKLWGFPTGNYHVPTAAEVQKKLALVDENKVEIQTRDSDEKGRDSKEKAKFVTLGADQQIDFGGIAKGYTGQKLAELFQEYGVSSALVSLGGNIQAIGTKPDGSSWKVGIRDPKGGQQDYIGVLSVENQAVITSGGYERYFEEDGKTYIHIINPRTGYPADGDLLSVTIVSRDGTLADGMSTALYIMGYEKACQFWRQHREEFNVILVTDDGKIHISENLKENFQTECDLEMIESESE